MKFTRVSHFHFNGPTWERWVSSRMMNNTDFLCAIEGLTSQHLGHSPFLSASANTKTYHLVGGNTATVVTGPRKCSNGQTTDVTMTVYAVLYSNSSRRSYFLNRKFDKRMELLDQWPSDKKGHILSSVFGGPAEIWNLAPHEPRGRRLTFRDTIMTGWYECERWIENALKTNDHLPVNATMKLTYDKAGSCRPTYWSIEATNSNPSQCPANNVIKGFGGSITCRKPT